MVQVNARFVVTCLVFWQESQLLAISLQRAVLADEPSSVGVWRLDESAHTGPSKGNTSRAPTTVRARRPGEPGDFERCFKKTVVLPLGSRFFDPTCAVEVARDKIDVFSKNRNTHCT